MFSSQPLGLHSADLARDRPYAERDEREANWLDRMAQSLWDGWLHRPWQALRTGPLARRAFVRRVRAHEAELADVSDDEIRRRAQALRRPLRSTGFAAPPVAEAFALIGEAAWRALGKRPYSPQLAAGSLLLRGTLVEMATGEGKTFAAALPAIAAALAGLPVHVITVSDYLAGPAVQLLWPAGGRRRAGHAARGKAHGLRRPRCLCQQQGAGIRLPARPLGAG
jgi:preprotein translocase subunit SecA